MQGRQFIGAVTVDCANGVGGPKLRELIKHLPSPSEGGLEIQVVNDDVVQPEKLNHQVYIACTAITQKLADNLLSSAELTMSRRTNERLPQRMRVL